MKKFLAVILSVIIVLSLAGCCVEESYIISEDGSLKATVLVKFNVTDYNRYMHLLYMMAGYSEMPEFTAEEMEEIFEEEKYEYTKSVEDGETFYIMKETEEVSSFTSETLSEGTFFSINEFVSNDSGISSKTTGEAIQPEFVEKLGNIKATYSVTFPKRIVCTNGVLSDDKKTVTWTMNTEDSTPLYAYTSESDKIITINIGNCTNKSKAKIQTYDQVKTITVNGKKQKSKIIKLKDEGKYRIKVVTKKASKTFDIIEDRTAPRVIGVKNGASYTGSVTAKFKDANGIKKATLNGKKVKTSGVTIDSKGNNKLVVTDNAGNKTTVTFTIK